MAGDPRPDTKDPRSEIKTTTGSKRYNMRVPAPEDSVHKHHRHAVYASETTGLLLIAFVLLILTLVRYWHEIHWSLR